MNMKDVGRSILNCLRGFADWQMDEQTNEWTKEYTLMIVESLSCLKNVGKKLKTQEKTFKIRKKFKNPFKNQDYIDCIC